MIVAIPNNVAELPRARQSAEMRRTLKERDGFTGLRQPERERHAQQPAAHNRPSLVLRRLFHR